MSNVRLTPIAIQIKAPRTALIFGYLNENYTEDEWNLLHENFIVFDRIRNGSREILSAETVNEMIDNGVAIDTETPWFMNGYVMWL